MEPPNPLQHEKDAKTVIQNYAAKGADDVFEARRRCWQKYPERMEQLKRSGKLSQQDRSDERSSRNRFLGASAVETAKTERDQ